MYIDFIVVFFPFLSMPTLVPFMVLFVVTCCSRTHMFSFFVVCCIYKATPIGNYVSGPLKISFRCGRAEFSNKATMK